MWQFKLLCPLLELSSMNLYSLVVSKPAVYQLEKYARKAELMNEVVLLALLKYPVSFYKMSREAN